jgi:hypothetical protein
VAGGSGLSGAPYQSRRDAFLQLVDAKAVFLQFHKAEAPFLLLGAGLRGLLQIVFVWFHDRTSLGESQVKGGASKAHPVAPTNQRRLVGTAMS